MWKNRNELLNKFGSVEIVDELIARKRVTGQYRFHPDLPGVEAAMLFYVPLLINYELSYE